MNCAMYPASQACTNQTCSNGAVFGVGHNQLGLATSKNVGNWLMMLMASRLNYMTLLVSCLLITELLNGQDALVLAQTLSGSLSPMAC
jgi:hypothetical protein